MTTISQRPPKRFRRRHFLKGAGGALLAIPFLPSLANKAHAQQTADTPKNFMAFATDHGGIWGQNLYPSQSVLTDNVLYAGREVRSGALPTTPDGGGLVTFSPMLQAQMSSTVAAKFNVLRGLDIPFYIGHHTGGHLGNFAGTVGRSIEGLDASKVQSATIDQAIAWSNGFYTDEDLQSRMTQRTFSIGGVMSYNFASPSTKSGGVISQPRYNSNLDLYRYLFQPASFYNNVDTFIVDRVKSSFQRLRRHPRLSYGDRARLDQHVERMFEVERKLAVAAGLTPPGEPTALTSDLTGGDFDANPATQLQYAQLMNDIIVAAFSTGVSRVGSWMLTNMRFATTDIGDWHGMVAHQGLGVDVAQDYAVGWNRGVFSVMADLAEKLDAVDAGDGSTLLDNSLLMFTSEAGQQTHHGGVVGYPVVTAGGAGGAVQTGRFIDYRNTSVTFDDLQGLIASQPALELEQPGLYYNQFLSTVMQVMGVDRSEYETFADFTTNAPVQGYGLHHVRPEQAFAYEDARAVIGDVLPVFATAGT